ncbi:protein kinase family protein [Vibrio splendidus]|uniref:protein kinase family protein n=1 Tax=Vibrio splendidus TaxID=29497 RepID=UPI000066F311|nr:protein kinase family protein [Vibrio splendidus]EAP95079.1 hypothetical protein V12B01_23210 [Vibrio splendidus 12B01]
MLFTKLKKQFSHKKVVVIYPFILKLFIRFVESKIIKEQGLDSIDKYLFHKWHDGFAYFKGIKNKNPHFIKVQIFGKHVLNELTLSKQISDTVNGVNGVNVLKPVQVSTNLCFSYAVFEFIEHRDVILDDGRLRKLFNVVKILNKNNIYLRDIKPDNILFVNGELVLFDFTFSFSNHPKFIPVDEFQLIASIGCNYRPEGYWDDMYSLKKVAEEAQSSQALLIMLAKEVGMNRIPIGYDSTLLREVR